MPSVNGNKIAVVYFSIFMEAGAWNVSNMAEELEGITYPICQLFTIKGVSLWAMPFSVYVKTQPL
jgi:hypothetical protein